MHFRFEVEYDPETKKWTVEVELGSKIYVFTSKSVVSAVVGAARRTAKWVDKQV